MKRFIVGFGMLSGALLFAGGPSAQGIGRIEGEWSNQSGYNIRIEPDQFGGWNLWGSAGQGSIQRDGGYLGGNIRVEADDMQCWLRSTVLHGDQDMRWRLIAAEGPKCNHLNGIFNRTAD